MLVNTKAIVISALKYGEADLIVRTFTHKSGLKSYMLKGVLKSKKGKFRASMFQPLTQLEIAANHRDKGTLEYLKDARIAHTYQSLHTNVVKSSLVMFLAEMLKSTIKEEEKNEALFHFLEHTFIWMDEHENVSNFHLLFLIKLTRYLGFYPDDSQGNGMYFNMLDGVFQPVKTNDYCIEGENIDYLKQLLGINFDELSSIKLNQAKRAQLINLLLLYYELHIEGFVKPRSLVVLNEIFS